MSQPTIYIFRGEYAFLNNFYPRDGVCMDSLRIEGAVAGDNHIYPTVEHAYQASKTISVQWQDRICKAKAAKEAKRLGKSVPLRSDWESVKLDVMLSLLRKKFGEHDDLAKKLVETGTARLVAGNTWKDTFWGMTQKKTDANGIRKSTLALRTPEWVGQNWLGKLLMQVRSELMTGKL